MADLAWRAPQREDDAAWADLLAAMELVDRHGETFELVDLADEWASVWTDPHVDAVFVWDRQLLVAFGWVKARRGRSEHHRIELWGGVRPSHRGRGIGRELLRRQVARARAIESTLDPSLPSVIRLEAVDHQHDLLALARRAGFVAVRRFLEVARPATSPEPGPPVDGVRIEHWTSNLDEPARAAHAEAFAGQWGSEPRTAEEWRQWYTGHRSFRADLSRVAIDEATDEVAAVVLCSAYPQDWHLVPREAWITTVGTQPGWRRRGVARALLTEVLAAVAASDTGFERSILGVDAENPGALALYRSFGFVDVRSWVSLDLGR